LTGRGFSTAKMEIAKTNRVGESKALREVWKRPLSQTSGNRNESGKHRDYGHYRRAERETEKRKKKF